MLEQRGGLEGVNARVDLANLCCAAVSAFCSTIASTSGESGDRGPCGHSQMDHPVPRSNRHCRLLGLMEAPELLNRLGADQRHVAGKDKKMLKALKSPGRAH